MFAFLLCMFIYFCCSVLSFRVSRRFLWDFISTTMSGRAVILTTHSYGLILPALLFFQRNVRVWISCGVESRQPWVYQLIIWTTRSYGLILYYPPCSALLICSSVLCSSRTQSNSLKRVRFQRMWNFWEVSAVISCQYFWVSELSSQPFILRLCSGLFFKI